MPMLYPTKAIARTSLQAPWRAALPDLVSPSVTLRAVRIEDAVSLFAMLGGDEVSRYVSAPPSTPEGFARFIAWVGHECAAGGHVCCGVVPAGMSSPVGLFQLHSTDASFDVVEWGCAIGSPFWGSGLFEESARLMMSFAFDVVGALRLEARAVVANGRGNGALRKIGAVQECVLRRSFLRHGRHHDQNLWAHLAEDWKLLRREPRLIVH